MEAAIEARGVAESGGGDEAPSEAPRGGDDVGKTSGAGSDAGGKGVSSNDTECGASTVKASAASSDVETAARAAGSGGV